MTTTFWFENRLLKWLASAFPIYNITTRTKTFWVGDQIKPKLSCASDVTCQQTGNSKCEMICDTDTWTRQGKLMVLKNQKLLAFTLISYINVST